MLWRRRLRRRVDPGHRWDLYGTTDDGGANSGGLTTLYSFCSRPGAGAGAGYERRFLWDHVVFGQQRHDLQTVHGSWPVRGDANDFRRGTDLTGATSVSFNGSAAR